ncbi:hypothetical protein RGQ29_000491 [Quercus rubra]|uniref:Secreted protein n=1 Tax=Quercus rubra TaxID=3512 RepID=A0AAN7G6F5_QUERU|nr:hypothetical protein RGQ29_000491 [Quercus rubra]
MLFSCLFFYSCFLHLMADPLQAPSTHNYPLSPLKATSTTLAPHHFNGGSKCFLLKLLKWRCKGVITQPDAAVFVTLESWHLVFVTD